MRKLFKDTTTTSLMSLEFTHLLMVFPLLNLNKSIPVGYVEYL